MVNMSVGKVYPCNMCKKAFSRNGDLTRHKMIHSGEKNFICEICGMRFAQRSGMKTHRNTHTGEKPHACDFCGKSFGDPSSCTRHEKEKHRVIIPFQCHICSSSIVRRSSFARHIREKHQGFVTKEYLDSLEAPMRAKPRGRGNARRRVNSTPAASEGIFKVDPPELIRRPVADRGYSSRFPANPPVAPVQTKGLDKPRLEHIVPRNIGALSLDFGVNSGVAQSGNAPVPQLAVSHHIQPYSAGVRQHEEAPLGYDYSLSSFYGGPPQYVDITYGVHSEPSSPEPLTPPDNKPPAYVEPAKINPYDYSQQLPYVAPPLYSYVPEQQPGLLFAGFVE